MMGCNGYLLETAECCLAVDAPQGFARWVQRHLPQGKRLAHLLVTHQHFDHVQDAAQLQEDTGCTVHAAAPYSDALTLGENLRHWGIDPVAPFRVDAPFAPGCPTLELDGLECRALHIPGHSTDGAAYYFPALQSAYVGDILFAGSIGRTDFPGGSLARLVAGIREHLATLPPDTELLCGHGPSTSVQEEMLNNPYLC